MILCGLFYSASAAASWAAEIAYSGFMGTVSAGPIYRVDEKQSVGLSLGSYRNGSNFYKQLNAIYRYAQWSFDRPVLRWKPLHIGAFVLYTTDQKRFFLTSPKKYPADGYYEQTALRGGAELGSTVLFCESRLAMALYFRILDNGLVAIYNNRTRDLQYFSSTGLGLQFHF